MTADALEVRDLVTGYDKQEIVHGVSLTARRGEISCVFGPNGSGKSTVIKAIAGALPTWSGLIRVGDTDLTARPAHEVVRCGVVLMPQGGGVFPKLTVADNLRVGGYSLPDRREVEGRIQSLADEFPRLKQRWRVAAGSLSGGEQMMVAIARALVPDPAFVLLDEPSAGLAPRMVHDTMARITALRDRGVGVIMVEQNIREALPIADSLTILAGGHVQFSGKPDQIRDDAQLMQLYMGASADE